MKCAALKTVRILRKSQVGLQARHWHCVATARNRARPGALSSAEVPYPVHCDLSIVCVR